MAKRRQHKIKEEHHGHVIALISILIALAAIGTIAYSVYTIFYQNAPQPQVVVLAGAVKTLGFTTYPTAITFASQQSTYYSTVANGRYALSVPGNAAYVVRVYYNSLAGFLSGSCDAGTVNLYNSTLLILNRNFEC